MDSHANQMQIDKFHTTWHPYNPKACTHQRVVDYGPMIEAWSHNPNSSSRQNTKSLISISITSNPLLKSSISPLLGNCFTHLGTNLTCLHLLQEPFTLAITSRNFWSSSKLRLSAPKVRSAVYPLFNIDHLTDFLFRFILILYNSIYYLFLEGGLGE